MADQKQENKKTSKRKTHGSAESSTSRSQSLPEENSKQHQQHQQHQVNKTWKRMDGLNPQENWKKIKRLANRRRGSSNMDKGKGKMILGDEDDTAGLSLLRRLEYNHIPVTLLAMKVQQDEKGHPRIPVLLSLLKVKINIANDPSLHDKKLSRKVGQLCVDVSYGTLVWTLYRQFWDFVKLHYSYCGYDLARARRPIGIPAFPSRVLHHPHRLRMYRHLSPQRCQSTQEQQAQSGSKSNSSLASDDRFSLGCLDDSDIQQAYDTPESFDDLPSTTEETSKPRVKSNQIDKQLEQYMMQLIGATLHTGNINRLCQFLEISALGIRLRATQPHGYHGKEGYMAIVTRTDHGPKHSRWTFGGSCFKSCRLPAYQGKNSPKWFIVRENYMVCVNHPHDIECYDVLLFEPGIRIERGRVHHAKSRTNKLKVTLKTAANLSLSHSTLCIQSSAGEMYLRAKNARQAIQFEQSLLEACRRSSWCFASQRFNSFAPVRSDCPTTWFVDGKDYFWQISVALENAQKYIYIHDWWLSPEVYLRRPAEQNEEWRLDKVLKRKADQGVKIYVIVYKEVAMAIPLFSHYTKKHLLSLSNNIYVQRHPSRALDILSDQGTLFYAHHEKICLIDGVVAFVGGLDLCYGRYDTAQHRVTDDPPKTCEQTWIGKDYSNPRIEDFHALDKPFEDNIDRSSFPRMSWHDISVRICGPAAHDVEHHFVQRWNFLRRQKSTAPKRPTPMLLPSAVDTTTNGLGTDDPRIGSAHTASHTQVQILRSVSTWSTGVEHTEHSIMDAYVDLINTSRHFIYIENQFFITSTHYGATVIDNKIGDALYQRILRAHQEKENWYAVIVMPLVPEFPGNFDLADGTTIRLIMYLQYLSIGRGPDSLLGKLRAAGVTNTSQYIKFYSLRNWGELNGSYVTEQVYVHAKTMIVDDRTVLIGSANINERSMLGCRDSEICACIEDMDLLDSIMGGEPVKVGRFAHSLRLRLMAEHLGLPMDGWDVDTLLDYTRPNMEGRKDTSSMANAPSCHSQPASSLQELSSQTIDQPLKQRTIITKKDHDGPNQFNSEEPIPPDDYTMNEDTLALYKEWATWDTDTDNNGDGCSLVPLPLLLKIASPDNDDGDNDDEEKEAEDDQRNHSAKSPALTVCRINRRKTDKDDDDAADDDDDAAADDDDDNATLILYSRLCDPLDRSHQAIWDTFARRNTDIFRRCFMVMPDNNVRSWAAYANYEKMAKQIVGRTDSSNGVTKHLAKAKTASTHAPINESCFMLPFIPALLDQIHGHLVVWPTHFMEDEGDDFVFAMDKIVPLEIFD